MIRVVVVALAMVVMLAGSASAECAWVLWVDDSQDSPLGSFVTKQECETRMERVTESQKKLGLVSRLNCYPDTMDPRPNGFYAVIITIKDFVEGPQVMTILILIGGVLTSLRVRRLSGWRYWLWILAGMLITSIAFGVISGLIRGFSR